jgi:L-amino acid N-acyltransferase YncA
MQNSGQMSTIRQASAADAAAIADIYNHYIRETIITFEELEVSSAEIAKRIAGVSAASLPWLVLEMQGGIVGYAYASKWQRRSAYRFTVETTVYMAPQFTGNGLGTGLYRQLLVQLKELGLHRAIGGVALPNEASVSLHEKLGFSKVAHFSEVGFKFGQWIDVGYWELSLEPSE